MSAPARAQAAKPLPLQRKCACGSGRQTGSSGCSDCRKKEQAHSLQRKARQDGSADALEREADRVAQQVLGRGADAAPSRTPMRVQRWSDDGGGFDTVVPSSVHETIAAPGRPLDPDTRRFFEPRFGHDFGQVRVHDDALADRSAKAVGALAYAVGPHLVFAGGQYAPRQAAGQQLLAHELVHVLQQGQSGAAGPNLQRKGRPTMELFVEAPFKGRILSSEALKKSGTRAKAYRYTGQLEAQVCETPDPKKARQCTPLAAGDQVEVVRIVNWPILYADDGVWVEGGAGWYEIKRPDAAGKTGYLLGVFVERDAPPAPKKEEDKEPEFDLPEPEKPKKPRGPERSAPDAVQTFCKPFPSKAAALRAHEVNRKGILGFAKKFGSDVQDIWRTYMDTPKTGVKGTLPPRRLFADPNSRVVKEFREDPETKEQRDLLFWKIFARVKGDSSLIPSQPGQATKFMPFNTVLKNEDTHNLPMSFKDPFNKIPGLLAGGYGKNSSDAGDDVRNVDGKFAITRTGDFDIRLSVVYIFDIFDAIDFCPGAPGSLVAQLGITDDLSRLEATPDVPTYDTPFEVVASTNKEEDVKL